MFIKYIQKINNICLYRTEKNTFQYFAFAIYGLVNTILPYLLWQSSHDMLSIILHAIASILCFILIFNQDWLPAFKHYINMYWYFTLFYCLPFLSTYTLFNNELSMGWTLNSVLSLFLLAFLVDWLAFLILLGSGVILGWLLYWSHNDFIQIKIWEDYNYIFLIYMYISAIIIGGVFARKKSSYIQEKENHLKLLSGSIAHELRTPLLTTAIGIKAIKDQCNFLVEANSLEQSDENFMSDAVGNKFLAINKVLENLDKINNASFTIIDIFLMKTKNEFNNEKMGTYSMQHCIETALNSYPLTDSEKSFIEWNKENDFSFKGNEVLMMHVLFNLLKNAIYYIKESNKGKIYISLSKTENFNILLFKDTGKGMSKNILDNIFQKFYSKTQYGTGIGLSFCKLVIEAFGGSINCRSKEGSYTEFSMYFPTIS